MVYYNRHIGMERFGMLHSLKAAYYGHYRLRELFEGLYNLDTFGDRRRWVPSEEPQDQVVIRLSVSMARINSTRTVFPGKRFGCLCIFPMLAFFFYLSVRQGNILTSDRKDQPHCLDVCIT